MEEGEREAKEDKEAVVPTSASTPATPATSVLTDQKDGGGKEAKDPEAQGEGKVSDGDPSTAMVAAPEPGPEPEPEPEPFVKPAHRSFPQPVHSVPPARPGESLTTKSDLRVFRFLKERLEACYELSAAHWLQGGERECLLANIRDAPPGAFQIVGLGGQMLVHEAALHARDMKVFRRVVERTGVPRQVMAIPVRDSGQERYPLTLAQRNAWFSQRDLWWMSQAFPTALVKLEEESERQDVRKLIDGKGTWDPAQWKPRPWPPKLQQEAERPAPAEEEVPLEELADRFADIVFLGTNAILATSKIDYSMLQPDPPPLKIFRKRDKMKQRLEHQAASMSVVDAEAVAKARAAVEAGETTALVPHPPRRPGAAAAATSSAETESETETETENEKAAAAEVEKGVGGQGEDAQSGENENEDETEDEEEKELVVEEKEDS